MMRNLIRVTLSRGTTPQAVDRYLYGNYGITGYDADNNWLYVEGEDRAGFTAQAIVDRLASGLIFAAVVEELPEAPWADPGHDVAGDLRAALRAAEDEGDTFPVVCANGCPEGYLGRHKFSCELARPAQEPRTAGFGACDTDKYPKFGAEEFEL